MNRKRPNRSSARKRAWDRLLKHLSEAEDWPARSEYGLLIGYKRPESLYHLLRPIDIDAIEAEALAARRARYSRHLAEIDKAVIRRAKGDGRTASADAKLAYQRLEGWEPGERLSLSGGVQVVEIVARFEVGADPTQDPKAVTEVVSVTRPALMEPVPSEPTGQE